jgi:hypothetical protein
LYAKPNVKSKAIILSIFGMVYAEIALEKKVNWMTMRISSTTKIIISSTPDIPCERIFMDKGLKKMMDHEVIPSENVEWSSTSSDDDQTR